MKNSTLKTILQEIKRHKATGEVFYYDTEDAQVLINHDGTTTQPTIKTSGYITRFTIANRTASYFFNRFEINKLNIRIKRMKQLITHQQPHAPFNYPGNQLNKNFSSKSSPISAQKLIRKTSTGGKILIAKLAQNISGFNSAQYCLHQMSVSRKLFNTSGLQNSDQQVFYRHELKWQMDIHNSPTTWFCEKFSDSPTIKNELFASVSSYLQFNSSSPGKLSGLRPVVLYRTAVSQLLQTLIPHFCGKRLNSRQSFLTDKIGEQIVSSKLSLHINKKPYLPGSNQSWDDEGMPISSKSLLLKGVFQQVYDDLLSAAQGGRSAGCCIRNQKLMPEPGWKHISLENGNMSDQDLINVSGTGMLILVLHQPHLNSFTGEFSTGYSGRLISKGVPGAWVPAGILSGNIFDLLQSVDAVGKITDPGQQITCPSIRLTRGRLS
ncbi:hypothetical protein K8T06_07700 [bacterium]|nr:hypothetical protein [bacterium]